MDSKRILRFRPNLGGKSVGIVLYVIIYMLLFKANIYTLALLSTTVHYHFFISYYYFWKLIRASLYKVKTRHLLLTMYLHYYIHVIQLSHIFNYSDTCYLAISIFTPASASQTLILTFHSLILGLINVSFLNLFIWTDYNHQYNSARQLIGFESRTS